MNQVTVVLHRPIYPRNVGMCARAMANLGTSRLVVVGAQTELGHIAKQGAAHAQGVLRSAVIYSTLQEFLSVEGEGVRIGLSGKDARMKVPDDFETTVELLAREPAHPVHDKTKPIYLMFGAEDDGLSREELEICHLICRLPTYSEVNSYNLSHAVLLSVFILRRAFFSEKSAAVSPDSGRTIEFQPAYFPKTTIRSWLEALGFDLSSPKVNIEKTLNRILMSQAPTQDELRTLDNVLHQTIRKLKSPKSHKN
jgi:TrmH family RNA methyltransferase